MNTSTETTTARATRRRFLRGAAYGAAAVFGAPAMVPASVFGAFAPSNRVNVAEIGTGNQSQVDLPAFLQQPDAQTGRRFLENLSTLTDWGPVCNP